jgi:hypothetical protein
LTHEDARTSIGLTSANIKLAEAMKRDSSSMRTVAVMTMAFLPGTFFAAVFAIPSLRWNEPRVIQKNFWIYWAFTLPFTGLVFLIWALLTYRNRIVAWSRVRMKAAGTAGDA